MRWSFLLLFIIATVVARPALACDCPPPGPAAKYVKRASAVFLGVVAFTDDDGSGKFNQKTLVRFEVEESFKGPEAGNHAVWVDPGSFWDCYASYRVGDRYLVFAYDQSVVPQKIKSNTKPAPPGFDVKNPPKVYSAPECTGTRGTSEIIQSDIDYLREFKARSHKPRQR